MKDERTTIVVDTETTSKYPHLAQVLEVAAVAYAGEQEVGCFQTLVYATPYELKGAEEALRINGITAEMLAGAPSPDYARALFRQFLMSFRSPELTAFNVGYDRKVLLNSKWLEGHEAWGQCVMLAAQRDMGKHDALEYNEYWGDYKWPRLSEAATYYRVVDEAGAHRALADARTAGRVMLAIRKAEEADGGGKGATEDVGEATKHLTVVPPKCPKCGLVHLHIESHCPECTPSLSAAPDVQKEKGSCVVCGVETVWRNPNTNAFQHLSCDETGG